MRLWIPIAGAAGTLLIIASFVGVDWNAPPVEINQTGYRGNGMMVVKDADKQEAVRLANALPEPLYEPDPEGDRAGDIYENVQVLGGLSSDQFNQFMASITQWVAPEAGCEYCHNLNNLASDEVYQKVVARRMIQMNQAINADYDSHVKQTGVTCYTCHRGNNIPEEVWHVETEPKPFGNAYRAGQNVAAENAGMSSLPQNALADYLLGDKGIRVYSNTALPTGDTEAGIKDAEHTWSLMMYMSNSLNVNCTFCHDSRAFNDWDQSPPQRVTAWHGIRMTREINNEYITGLAPVFPDHRKGPEGDVLKVGCATCHNGAPKPLNGQSMMSGYGDSLGQKTETGHPNYENYTPGEEGSFTPAQSSDAGRRLTGSEFAQSE